MKEIGIYIHIPFCKKKCIYCDFASFEEQEKEQKRYINALKREISIWRENEQKSKIDTVYIGGGTPSYIESTYIVEIIGLLKELIEEDAEITIEVNPGTVTLEKLEDYKKAGVNRISIGLQSTKDYLLKELGRIHTYEQFLKTYNMAREKGFKNINVDLMIGLPNQTIKDIEESLKTIVNLEPNPEHISVYSLIVEENTVLYQKVENGEMKLPDEDSERNMYWYVKDFLEINGYKHYEISNFSKIDRSCESKHNMNCWKQHEYRGFGLNAHSYVEGKRFCNIDNLEEYIKNIGDNKYEKNIVVQEIQNKNDIMKEYMLLGLRKIEGISIQEFELKFNENPIMIFRKKLKKLIDEELLIIDEDAIKLSNKGLDLANLVWEEFV